LVVVAVVGAGVLSLAGMTAEQYLNKSPLGGGRALLWLLGPAVQVLALGLARRFAVVQQRTVAVVVPIVALSALSLYVTPHLARLVGLPRDWGLPLALRSVTSAVGLSLADGLPADPTRVAAAIVVTGVFVGQVGPGLLTGCAATIRSLAAWRWASPATAWLRQNCCAVSLWPALWHRWFLP
jgi:putative effector of murein hydrolase